MDRTALLLAHQGGWDEIAFVLAPLAVFAALLAVARRRVGQLERPDGDEDGDAPPADPDARDGVPGPGRTDR